MVLLADVSHGRDNNFNLVRMAAASAVLVSHAWPMIHGDGAVEPLEALTGQTLGGYAVYVFFALSGFFISASFARSGSARTFLWARGLRLFPGLAVSFLVTALVIGPLVTALSLGDYLTNRAIWTFFLRNLTLWSAQYTLPGVFETNPYPAVEGSIWTLVHEVMCYAGVLVVGVVGLLRRRGWMTALLAVYGALWLVPEVHPLAMHPKLVQLHDLSLPFAAGMVFWLWQDRIRLSWVGVAGLAFLGWVAHGTPLGGPAMVLALTYATFWLGFLPAEFLRRYNRLGDYSYGTYLYAFPLQGLVVWLAGPTSPALHIALAFPLTLICAVLSWHYIEAPALELRKSRSQPDRALRNGGMTGV